MGNPLPAGFGAAMKRHIRAGVPPKEAMRRTWREFKTRYAHKNNSRHMDPGAIQRRRYAERMTFERGNPNGRGRRIAGVYFCPRHQHWWSLYDDQTWAVVPKKHVKSYVAMAKQLKVPWGEEYCPKAREEGAIPKRFGRNPGRRWHLDQAERDHERKRAAQSDGERMYYTGKVAAHEASAKASWELGMNPWVVRSSHTPPHYFSKRGRAMAFVRRLRRERYAVEITKVKSFRPVRRQRFYGNVRQRQRGGLPLSTNPRRIPRKVYAGKDRLTVVPLSLKEWILVDRRRNVYFRGTPEEIRRHIAQMVERGSYTLKKNPAGKSNAKFCVERLRDPKLFDKRSFRTVVARRHRVTVGCPRGQWDAGRKRCRVQTVAQRILHPEGEGRCPVGGQELRRVARNPYYGRVMVGSRLERRLGPFPTRRAARKAVYQSADRARATVASPVKARVWHRKNPRQAGRPVLIYDRLLEIRARKGRQSQFPGELFKHPFTSGAKVYGMPDGSLRIAGPKRLWGNIAVR